MSDLISRQAAIDALREIEFSHYMEFGEYIGEDTREVRLIRAEKAQDTIEQLPSAQPEQRWIPCSERLPEANGRYLVTRGLNACGSLWNRVYITNYSDLMGLKSERIWWDGNVGKSDFERIDDVIAWMPLPEPYAERRTDEL